MCIITFAKTTNLGGQYLDESSDYLVWYARNKGGVKFRRLYDHKIVGDAGARQYRYLFLPEGNWRELKENEMSDPNSVAKLGKIFSHDNFTSQTGSETTVFEFSLGRDKISAPLKGGWKTNRDGVKKLIAANRLIVIGNTPRFVRYLDDFPIFPINNRWTDTVISGFGEEKIYVVQTMAKVISRCLLMTTDPGDLVFDPTCGSGTTAYVAEQWGRRWITCDTSRVSLALTRTRLMAAKFPYFLLTDSHEGIQKEAEVTAQVPAVDVKPENDIKKGFVYRRVPHITLKNIANNPDIKEGMIREEIDAAIARHADTELLYDQPYEDSRKIRVTGPFTVESLSPHRLLSTDDERPVTEAEARKESSDGQFATMIIENLRKAGVQNTLKHERLKFDRLEPFAGTWIQATGEYSEKDGKPRRVAISIGPEHGTVGRDQIKEAAKEAVQGIGFDLLIVCGFAFEPLVSEEAKRYGKLMVMPTRMNYDLTMGDDLLKKTGAGNLFMYFGEPDIEVKPQKDGTIVVKIKGLDIYDPTTGEIRSHSTDDIACWFIDTNYNGESFFVRHAYFTGAEEPYDKLKRALRAEIDEAAWLALYSTTSRPFDLPKTGKIAIKVINHYGDEVLKVYSTHGD